MCVIYNKKYIVIANKNVDYYLHHKKENYTLRLTFRSFVCIYILFITRVNCFDLHSIPSNVEF